MVSNENDKERRFQLLADILLSLSNHDECRKFIEYFLTPYERDVLAQRIIIALKLTSGEQFNRVVKDVKASSATVGRVQRMIYSSDDDFLERFLFDFSRKKKVAFQRRSVWKP